MMTAASPNDTQIAYILADGGYRRDISAAINPRELSELLRQKGLGVIVMDECESNQLLPNEYAECILKRVQEQGGTALTDFLWCLEQTSESHLGHKYATDILKRTDYNLETLSAIMTSTVLKQRFQSPLRDITRKTRDINVLSIFP